MFTSIPSCRLHGDVEAHHLDVVALHLVLLGVVILHLVLLGVVTLHLKFLGADGGTVLADEGVVDLVLVLIIAVLELGEVVKA